LTEMISPRAELSAVRIH